MSQPEPHFFTVIPKLPERLQPLREMAYNLLFAWNAEIRMVFRRASPELWVETGHNPVLLLARLSTERIRELERDEAFMAFLERTYEHFREYMEKPAFTPHRDIPEDLRIAYFSAEYGLTDCLPFYHGGLGILAGDFLKSASDLNLPVVGVGLLYQYGAFKQTLTEDGEQRETVPELDFYHMPITLLRDEGGEPLTVELRLDHEHIYAQIWRVQVGRIPLYLLDANVPQNPPHLREITSQPYPDDRRQRLIQEMLLGIGGMRALRKLGIDPTIVHMNEGHSAFAGLERIRVLREEQELTFDEALLLVMASNVFTTHTSVPAGIDLFDPGLIERFFSPYLPSLGITLEALLGLGRRDPKNQSEPFCMNILAQKLSGNINAVSRLHRKISQRLWHDLWPRIPEEDVPINYVTNGVHVPSWVSQEMAETYTRYLGPNWSEDPDNVRLWNRAMEIPDEELWGVHERRRGRLVAFCRRRLRDQLLRRGAPTKEVEMATEVLNPDALTIVWARRMVTYKRPLLIFRDLDRLARILDNPERPVQIIMAGKAHPNDLEGKRLIKEIISIIKEDPFRQHVVFIEDYDMDVARYLVQGADIWLNTPRRPDEACGTSGMKAVFNGALHFSTLDGWWDEAFNPLVGWAIGRGEVYKDHEYQDDVESHAFYTLMENEIIPLFYKRGPDGIPREWVAKMKAAMKELGPLYNTNFMIQRYMEDYYLRAHSYLKDLTAEGKEGIEELAAWYRRVSKEWKGVKVVKVEQDSPPELEVGDQLKVRALLDLGTLRPEDVRVDLYYGPLDPFGKMKRREIHPMELMGKEGELYVFAASLPCSESGRFAYYCRVTPHHRRLIPTHYSLGLLVTWG